MKILFIGLPIQKGSGGETIRARNFRLLQEAVGEENVERFTLPLFSFYSHPFSGREIKACLVRWKRNLGIKKRLRQQLRTFSPDLVYLDNSMTKLPGKGILRKYKTVVFFHNVEQNYARQNYGDNAPIIDQIAAAERTLCRYATACVCINRRDSDQLKALYGRSGDYILPISFDDCYRKTDSVFAQEYLLFVGSDFFGNTDGLFWFIENCLDKTGKTLVVIGTGMEKYKRKYPDKSVLFFGYVSDLAPWYNGALCVVLPIISGSGMKTKTCEALMYGKRIYGTREAFEGYQRIEEADCVRCDTEEAFVRELQGVNRENCPEFSQSSRDYFLKYYCTDRRKEDYFRFLRSV